MSDPNPDFILFTASQYDLYTRPYMPLPMYKTIKGWEGKTQVQVAAQWKDAREGRGRVVEKKKLRPWSQEMWDRCVEYMEKRTKLMDELKKEFEKLRRECK